MFGKPKSPEKRSLLEKQTKADLKKSKEEMKAIQSRIKDYKQRLKELDKEKKSFEKIAKNVAIILQTEKHGLHMAYQIARLLNDFIEEINLIHQKTVFIPQVTFKYMVENVLHHDEDRRVSSLIESFNEAYLRIHPIMQSYYIVEENLKSKSIDSKDFDTINKIIAKVKKAGEEISEQLLKYREELLQENSEALLNKHHPILDIHHPLFEPIIPNQTNITAEYINALNGIYHKYSEQLAKNIQSANESIQYWENQLQEKSENTEFKPSSIGRRYL